MKKMIKYVILGGIIGGVYSLISFFLTHTYNIDGTSLEFLMPIVSTFYILSYFTGTILATFIFIFVGILIGFMIGNYKEFGIAILISIFLSYVALYFSLIVLEDSAPIVWIAPLIFAICLFTGGFIKYRRRNKKKK